VSIGLYVGGYVIGAHRTALKYELQITNEKVSNENAIIESIQKNADKITTVENTKNTQIAEIQGERDKLQGEIDALHHPDCIDLGNDFRVLYNQSTGNSAVPTPKPATTQSPGNVQADSHADTEYKIDTTTILQNDLTCRALAAEYQMCYNWATLP